jgi:hypothetical protein
MKAVDITGIDKGQLLAALFNNAAVMGMGYRQDIGRDLTNDEARELVEKAAAGERSDDHGRMFGLKSRGRLYFDYLYGRPLKTDLCSDRIDPCGYDRDNGGPGTLAGIVEKLRAGAS